MLRLTSTACDHIDTVLLMPGITSPISVAETLATFKHNIIDYIY